MTRDEELLILQESAASAIARAMRAGARKYEPGNWASVPRQEHLAAAARHLKRAESDEPMDAETGVAHLDLAETRLAMARESK